MPHTIEHIIQKIAALSLPDTIHSELVADITAINKQLIRADFMLQRTLKDKSIMVNLLNESINELQTHQAIIEKVNQEVAAQNNALAKQKQLIEEHSNELSTNLHKLEMSYAELEQFSFIASHDLKSPLRAITSYAQLLQLKYRNQLDSDANTYLNFIVNGSKQMNNVICDLLEYAQTGRGAEFETTNINEIIDVVKFNLKEEITENQAVIQYKELPKVTGSRTGLILLFQNLLGNAIKFRGDAPPIIDIHHRQEKGFLHFSVEDNGVGLEPQYQEKVFQPFQRINQFERPGTGMGLAICKKVVKQHQGDIWYAPRNPNGTSFHFKLLNAG